MKKQLKSFILYINASFLVLICIIGACLFVFDLPIIGGLLQIAGAWISTIVFLIMFPRIYPNDHRWSYIKKQLKGKVKRSEWILILFFFVFILLGNVLFISLFGKRDITTIVNGSIATLAPTFLLCLIQGPMGEEMGWRAFFLTEVKHSHGLMKASIITGFLWSMWHFPLILVSQDTIELMIVQFLCNTIAFISLTYIMAVLYERSKNLWIPILIHQSFNFSLSFIQDETILSTIGLTLCTCIFSYMCFYMYKRHKQTIPTM